MNEKQVLYTYGPHIFYDDGTGSGSNHGHCRSWKWRLDEGVLIWRFIDEPGRWVMWADASRKDVNIHNLEQELEARMALEKILSE